MKKEMEKEIIEKFGQQYEVFVYDRSITIDAGSFEIIVPNGCYYEDELLVRTKNVFFYSSIKSTVNKIVRILKKYKELE